ncbi:hypothetical protein AB0I28_23235 [Phytomonospora sp. NPDC050363]|uniref:hypothetical protein n=1 Tax=Phytomonospora sp. NPDC050363 TaxID=3155642 RepID=UPI0033E81D98
MNRLNALTDRILGWFLTSGTAAADDCVREVQTRYRLCTRGSCYDRRVCRYCVLGGNHCGEWSICTCPA